MSCRTALIAAFLFAAPAYAQAQDDVFMAPQFLKVQSSTPAQNDLPPITEVRGPEIFGQIGFYRAGTDDGDIGNAASYGAVMVVPFSPRVAVEVDIQTSRVAETERLVDNALFGYVVRRVLVIPALTYRFGADRLYGLAGAGLGVEFEDSTTRINNLTGSPDFREVLPGIFELRQSERNPAISLRGGVVAFPTRRFGIRGDVYLAGYSLGARIGLGYRFR